VTLLGFYNEIPCNGSRQNSLFNTIIDYLDTVAYDIPSRLRNHSDEAPLTNLISQPAPRRATTAIMSLTNCRFYEEKYPEIDSFVMVNVKQVRNPVYEFCQNKE
jgi:hypothetical protein